MSITDIHRSTQVVVPIYELDGNGHVKPNPLFHRPVDKLHSRCVEYPFAASRLGKAKTILDVGTVKADPLWIDWLENLPAEVHATDFDEPLRPFRNITFHQADIRHLPLPDAYFERVFAVSVIEHVGLESPQVFNNILPAISRDGDLEAFKELARVLKPGGELIMTVPFGLKDGLILGNQARNYTIATIKRFEKFLPLYQLEYYEYQKKNIHDKEVRHSAGKIMFERLFPSLFIKQKMRYNDDLSGEATWRNVPLELTKALHHAHVDGVACGVWKKNMR